MKAWRNQPSKGTFGGVSVNRLMMRMAPQWPPFPSELMFNLLVKNGYITAP